MKIPRSIKAGSVLAAALLFAGCFNLLEPPMIPREQGAAVTFTIAGEGGMARTVLPKMSQFVRMELTARARDGGAALPPVDISGGTAAITLTNGSWDIAVKAYTTASAEPAATASAVVVNTGGVISGETRLTLLPSGTGPGILRYTVALPAGIDFDAAGSRIRAEQQGEARETRAIAGSVEAEELSLAPGIYAADILLKNTEGKTAVFRQAVSILSGLATEIAFAPAAGDFLDPEARALLTAQVLFKTTANNSSQTVIGSGGGGDVRRTQILNVPRGTALVYFTVQKLAAQTITVGGADAAKVGMGSAALDGTSPSSILAVFSVDTSDIAESGGDRTFVLAVAETGKTPIETAVTIPFSYPLSIEAKMLRRQSGNQVMELTYQVGDVFNRESIAVTARYSDGASQVINDYTIEGFDSATPGIKNVRVSKNGLYAQHTAYDALETSAFEIKVLERIRPRLVFNNGNWETSGANPPAPGYTTPLGRPLVLAPVKWLVPDNAVYTWTVSGGPHSSAPSNTEYFTFEPSAQGEYTITVSTFVDGQTLSASAKVACCPPEGTYRDTARNMDDYNGGSAPTQFNAPGDGRVGGSGFGGVAGSRSFAQSVPNGNGYDLSIKGNAFGGWIEPGIVWVAQDSNGNGKMDDTWYELKGGTEGVEIMKRYAVTFYKNGSWQDNLGNADEVQGGADWYPRGNSPEWITLTGTRIVSWEDEYKVTGYVDAVSSLFDISDAIQADGTPVHLDYIDFVTVKTAEHYYTGIFGEKSTEIIGAISVYSAYDNARKLTGTAVNNDYQYKLVNNSGYALTVSVAVLNGAFTDHTLNPGADETFTLGEASAYFDYSGGNVSFVISGNTVTFSDN